MHRVVRVLPFVICTVQLGCDVEAAPAPRSNPNVLLPEELGEAIFFDTRLSLHANQACAVCHAPDVGYSGPELLANLSGSIYEGSVEHRFGNRRAPQSSYNVFAPVFTRLDDQFVGGTFWDGRATGWALGSPAADQAGAPFLNPVEQALPSGAAVVDHVCHAEYKIAFKWLWGAGACTDSARGFAAVAQSIVAFEQSPMASPFRSKYDAYLQGQATLTQLEAEGLALFNGAGRCANCHVLDVPEGLPGPLFTDFTYDNIGVPRNLDNPFYFMDGVEIDGEPINPLGFAWIDPGLGGHIERLAADDEWRNLPHVPDEMLQLSAEELAILAQSERGKHKVPSVRNVDLRPYPSFPKAYTHNGYFKTLAGLVHFYNTRDLLPACAGDFPEAVALELGCWPPPEVAENVNTEEMGDLGLSPEEEAAIVAFLGTLSDRP